MARKSSTSGAVLSALLSAGASAVAAYTLAVRPWHMRWGAAASEVTRPLPGDDLVPDPKYRATHAVTVRAAAADVWPWLVQIGQGRAGFYSYDWLENLLGLNIHSAETIVPEWQDLQPGDTIPLAPNGFGMPVVVVDPNRALALGGRLDASSGEDFSPRNPEDFFAASWAFVLEPVAPDVTRLIERFQLDYNPTPLNTLLYRALLEPGSFLMERRMLLGVKARAERLSGTIMSGSAPIEYELQLDE